MGFIESVRAWYSNKDTFNGTVAGLISAGLLGAPLYAVRLTRLVIRHTRLGLTARLLGLTLGWLLVAYFVRAFVGLPVLFLGMAVVLSLSTLWVLQPISKLGIVDAHSRTVNGINFKSSLKLAQSSIDFLGIGADKLTSLKEFEPAMLRCGASGNRVRFLLSPPDNPILERHAKRNDVDASAYKNRVRESLHRIAQVKKKHDLFIEVRFYPAVTEKDLQQFRLMFVDRLICLAGWSVWGKHEGKNNPQMVLKERHRDHPDITAFKMFHDHFEALWDDADTQPVDLSIYG